MFLQLFQYLSNNFYMLFIVAFGINKNVIKIYYYKNIEFLY